MKYIYIDGGARVGESVEIILDKRLELIGCDAYMFECNTNHIDTLLNLKNTNVKYNFLIKNEAIWVKNEAKYFYISNDVWGDLGCTLKPDKKESLDLDNPIMVQCIDFNEFINQFDDDSYIIVKLDIEGAEYEVLNSLLDNGSINKINELYVEFHDNFFGENSTSLKERLLLTNVKCDFNWM
jgi:FkbM family methyltransferase